MASVLIVFHSLGGNTKAAADAVKEGAAGVPGIDVEVKSGLKAGPDDLLACDAIAVGSPDFFSYMAGGLKDFFDRSFYPTQNQVNELPCGIFVSHGGGGKPAAKSIEEMCKTFKFKLLGDPILVRNAPGEEDRKRLIDLGRRLGEEAISS